MLEYVVIGSYIRFDYSQIEGVFVVFEIYNISEVLAKFLLLSIQAIVYQGMMSGATQGHHGMAYGPGPNGNASSNQVAKLFSKELVYKFNTPDAGKMYLLTTEAIVTFVAENYGVAMMNLVKYGKDKTFTKPGTKGLGTAPTTCSKDKDGLAVYDIDNDRVGFLHETERRL